MEATSAAVFDLDTRERFIYEYGLFVLEWNAFELYVEALIWYVRSKRLKEGVNCIQNFRKINQLSPNKKRSALIDCLRRINESDVLDAVNKAYDVAERNQWIHGLVIPIKVKEGEEHEEDTWLLYRFNKVKNRPKFVRITESDHGDRLFVEFHEAWRGLKSAAERAFGFLMDVADYYLVTLAEEERLRRQSQSN